MNKKINNVIEKIKKVKWNDKNLEKHTKKHPIDESEMDHSRLIKWASVLGFYDITEDFNKTKNAYKEESEKLLSISPNTVMYYHNGPNNSYRSIGIFEDKEREKDEEILTSFIRYNKRSGYYITTCYLRKIQTKEKLYFAYELLKRPDEFKLNISEERFKEIIGLPNSINFSKVTDLISKEEDDIVAQGLIQYRTNGKIESSTIRMLYQEYNFMLSDLKEIDDKIDKNNQLLKGLEQLYKKHTTENIYFENFAKRDKYETIHKFINLYKDKMNLYYDKYFKSSTIQIFNKIFDNTDNTINDELLEKLYDELYNNTYKNITNEIKIDLTIITYNKITHEIKLGRTMIITCYRIKKLIEYLKYNNKELFKEKNNIKYELNRDSEHLFYISLYRGLISKNKDYQNKIIDYDLDYNNEIIELLELDK